jgi:PTS system cellobiose-specific IIB component
MNRQEGVAMRILVVCGAGASSTFVAMWVRKAAAARGLDVIASASSETELDELAADNDVVLIGPHLADRFDDLAERVRARGASAVLVPEVVITTRDGDAALDLALAATAPDKTAPDTMQQEKSNG